MFNALVIELKEELGIAMFIWHENGHESEEEAKSRIDKVCAIMENAWNIEELKDIKEELKTEKSKELKG